MPYYSNIIEPLRKMHLIFSDVSYMELFPRKRLDSKGMYSFAVFYHNVKAASNLAAP